MTEGLDLGFGSRPVPVERVREFYPRVLDHFNSYVKEAINPVLPPGYSLSEITDIFFDPEGWVFRINVSHEKLQRPPNGSVGDLIRACAIIDGSCDSYELRARVVRINLGAMVTPISCSF